MRVLVFGDSIAFGGYDSQGGWVDRIKREYIRQFIEGGERHAIINLGIGGDVSTLLVDRIEGAIASAQVSSKEISAVVSIGTNDARWIDKAGNPQTTDQAYAAALHEIFENIKQATTKILVPGLCGIKGEGDLQFKNYIYSSERISKFNKILEKVATKHGAVFVDVQRALQSDHYFHDGLHLNDAGHKTIADIIQPKLEKILRR